MNDKDAIKTYSQFRECRKSIGYKYIVAEYHDLSKNETYPVECLPFLQISRSMNLELANSINGFSRYLHDLEAWSLLLKGKNQDAIWEILLEFIEPICLYCLGAPYSIKNKFTRSISEISHQANRFKEKGWKDNINMSKIDFKSAEKYSKTWNAWPRLYLALSELNNEDYIKATSDFRNCFNHSFPRNIEIGISGIISREIKDSKHTTYKIGGKGPLHISDLIPHLSIQYKASIDCYEKYIAMVKEQYQCLQVYSTKRLANMKI